MRQGAQRDKVDARLPHRSQVVGRDTARSFDLDATGNDRDRCTHFVETHVVQHDPGHSSVECRPDVVQCFGLDLETELRRRGVERRHCRPDPAGEAQVVVLDEQRLAQVHAVVGSAAAPHRVLLQLAQAGRGLASVEQRGVGPGQLGHATCRQRGDPRQPAEQVERGPFATQDGPGRAGDAGNLHRYVVDAIAVGHCWSHDHRRIQGREDGCDDGQPGDDARLLDEE